MTFEVRLHVTDVAALRRTRDATVPATLGRRPRAYQAQEDGRVLLTPVGGGQVLRLPLAAAPRPATTTAATGAAVVDPVTGLGGVTLAGGAVSNGSGADAVDGLVGAFQLQAVDALLPACTNSLLNRSSASCTLCSYSFRGRLATGYKVAQINILPFAVTSPPPWPN